MVNKYLEKIALSTGHAYAIGTGAGAAIGGALGYRAKDIDTFDYNTGKIKNIKLTKSERVSRGVRGGIAGGLLGAWATSKIHSPGHRSYYRSANPYRDSSHHELLEKVNLKAHAVSTKKQVEKTFKEHLHRNHPDKFPGNKHMEEKYKDISVARDQIKETDWFKKLAAIRDLRTLSYMKRGRKTYKELAAKFNVVRRKPKK